MDLANFYKNYYLEQIKNNEYSQTGFGRNRFFIPQIKRFQKEDLPSDVVPIASIKNKRQYKKRSKGGLRKKPKFNKKENRKSKVKVKNNKSIKVKNINQKTRGKKIKLVKRKKSKFVDIFS